MTATELARREGGVQILNPHDAGYDELDASQALPWLATISAGKLVERKDQSGNTREVPTWNRDRSIQLHDRNGQAPFLASQLRDLGGKHLFVSFLENDPSRWIQQSYELWTSGRHVAYSDDSRVVIMRKAPGQEKTPWATAKATRHVVRRSDGEEAYVAALREILAMGARPSYSIAFYVATWHGNEHEIRMDDGMSPYRLRTGSRRSLANIVSSALRVAELTTPRGPNGEPIGEPQIAGIPFRLNFTIDTASDREGFKHEVPRWRAECVLPGGLAFTPRTFVALAKSGRDQMAPIIGAHLAALPEPSETGVAALAEPSGRCDKQYWTKAFWAVARDTPLEDDDERGRWFAAYSNGRHGGLSAYLSEATEDQADALVRAVRAHLGIAVLDPSAVPEGAPPAMVADIARQMRHSASMTPEDVALASRELAEMQADFDGDDDPDEWEGAQPADAMPESTIERYADLSEQAARVKIEGHSLPEDPAPEDYHAAIQDLDERVSRAAKAYGTMDQACVVEGCLNLLERSQTYRVGDREIPGSEWIERCVRSRGQVFCPEHLTPRQPS